MNVKFFYCLLIVFSLGFTACSDGEDGIDGIDGIDGVDGEQGPQGPQGPAGEAGNANVILYEFGSQTFTNLLELHLNISRETVDNSMILVYYNPGTESQTAWFPSPGLGSSGDYMTRTFIYQSNSVAEVYTLGIRALTPDGTAAFGSPLTFRKVKVIFAEASTIVTAQMEDELELGDYQQVKAFYGLED